MGQKVVEDEEHARAVVRDTIGVEWNDTIMHPEAQVIVACAMIVNGVADLVDSLVARVESLEEMIREMDA